MSAKQIKKIPVHEVDATKKKIHPRFITGKYQNIRLVSMYSIFIAFLIMPWIRSGNRQAIQFDFSAGRINLFQTTFLPQDFFFFAFVFIIAAIMLFMVTVYAGRVWCGYACPQTIWVHLFQYTEKIILGDRNKRIKFDKEALSVKKFAKLSLLHSVWLIFSLITALTFVSYAVGTDALYFSWQQTALGIPLPNWTKLTYIGIGIFVFCTYINAGYMREHMCVHICPYGRFQSVMFDKDTLIVSYDYERGEPRGARKKGTHPTELGDCVECTMCVQVCPTGIDIRDGLQVECIQCAACIDACNDIMDKVGYPRGLIRYTTERQLVEKQATRILSPRIFAYIFLLVLMFAGATFLLLGRQPLEMEVRHDRKQLSTVNADGVVQNSYIVKITNKTNDPHTYFVKLEPKKGLALRTRFAKLPLDPDESYDVPISIYGNSEEIAKGETPITITVHSEDGKFTASKNDLFVNQ